MVHLGKLLAALRLKRGLSQAKLAERAQVGERTLPYWEANEQQPRDVEFESLLTALDATPEERGQIYALLPDTRIVRLAQSAETNLPVHAALLGTLSALGDLLRAMRMRQGLT